MMRGAGYLWVWVVWSVWLYASSISYRLDISGEKIVSRDQIEEAIGVKRPPKWQFWRSSTPTIQATLLPSLEESLGALYRSEGFYESSFEIKQTQERVAITIEEGKPVRVDEINITSDFNLSTLIDFKRGDIFQSERFVQIKASIIKALLAQGYCSYDLDTKAYVDLDTLEVDLLYRLKKGGLCSFGQMQIKGLESIDESVVASRMVTVKGEVFDLEKIKQSRNNLYRLEAFDSVIIRTDRKIYNVIPIDIEVKEKQQPHHIEFGVGYDTYVGLRTHAKFTKYNFLGNAKRLDLHLGYSDLERWVDLDYKMPLLMQLFRLDLGAGLNAGYSDLEFDGFVEEKRFIKGYLHYANPRLNLHLGLTTEHIQIDDVDNLEEGQELEQAVNAGDFNLFYPYIDLIYDARDSKLNPKKGYYLGLSSEFGLAREEESSIYLKALLEGRAIYTMDKMTLSSVAKVGIVDEKGDSKGLPESKYFFAGGTYSNRAYGYQRLGVIVSPTQDSIYGASSMLNLSFEVNYPLYKQIYGAIFNDNTMLTEESYDFDGEVISTLGVGVRYVTPIGPFKVDVGFNSHDASQYGITFQIGQSF
jgi:outer membrane protein assembly factor BamA